MKKMFALASLAAFGLGLAACDSPAEEAAEERAENIEDRADMMEDEGMITDNEEAMMNERADAIEDSAEGDTDVMTDELEEPTM